MGFMDILENIVLFSGGLLVLFFGLVTIAVAVLESSIIVTIIGLVIIVFSLGFINQEPEITN
ncbi:Uncharacterised protein [uncultured archaeon]|nr:Uncharacterised protein [uncultured archaeon]